MVDVGLNETWRRSVLCAQRAGYYCVVVFFIVTNPWNAEFLYIRA